MIWGLAPHPMDPNAVFAGVGAIDRGDPLAPLVPTVPAVCDGPGEVLLTRDRGESWQLIIKGLPAFSKSGHYRHFLPEEEKRMVEATMQAQRR